MAKTGKIVAFVAGGVILIGGGWALWHFVIKPKQDAKKNADTTDTNKDTSTTHVKTSSGFFEPKPSSPIGKMVFAKTDNTKVYNMVSGKNCEIDTYSLRKVVNKGDYILTVFCYKNGWYSDGIQGVADAVVDLK